jgi:hypothetical protein
MPINSLSDVTMIVGMTLSTTCLITRSAAVGNPRPIATNQGSVEPYLTEGFTNQQELSFRDAPGGNIDYMATNRAAAPTPRRMRRLEQPFLHSGLRSIVRLPSQFVFAFVDGLGWRRREGDLRRIYQLWEQNSIDGLYSLARMDDFHHNLREAAVRLRLLQE